MCSVKRETANGGEKEIPPGVQTVTGDDSRRQKPCGARGVAGSEHRWEHDSAGITELNQFLYEAFHDLLQSLGVNDEGIKKRRLPITAGAYLDISDEFEGLSNQAMPATRTPRPTWVRAPLLNWAETVMCRPGEMPGSRPKDAEQWPEGRQFIFWLSTSSDHEAGQSHCSKLHRHRWYCFTGSRPKSAWTQHLLF